MVHTYSTSHERNDILCNTNPLERPSNWLISWNELTFCHYLCLLILSFEIFCRLAISRTLTFGGQFSTNLLVSSGVAIWLISLKVSWPSTQSDQFDIEIKCYTTQEKDTTLNIFFYNKQFVFENRWHSIGWKKSRYSPPFRATGP